MNKTKPFIILILMICLIGGAMILYQQLTKSRTARVPTSKESTDKSSSTKAPDFKVQDAKGNDIQFHSLVGKKKIVLNFWASWCPPCKGEMPEFEKIHKKYSNDVAFVMVNMTDGSRETVETASAYINENKYTMPMYFDVHQDAATNYQVASLPTTYFVDLDGNISNGYQGQINEKILEKEIEEM